MGHKKCRVDGCDKWAKQGGVCVKHGAKVTHKRCSRDGCTNKAQKGGLCWKHGAKVNAKLCNYEGGCPNLAVKGGVCIKHGAKVTHKRCSSEGCTKQAKKGGVCMKHGAKVKRKRCSSVGCTKWVVQGGLCKKHGAKVKRCSIEGCQKQALRRGLCYRHGGKKRKATNEAVEESEETSPHMIEQDGGEIPPSVDQHTSTRAKKRRRVSSAATSSTDTEEEEMAANANGQAEETSQLTRRSTEEDSGEDEKEEEEEKEEDDDDDDEGGDNNNEDEDRGGGEDWEVEGEVEEEEEQTQSHIIEVVEEGKEVSYEQLHGELRRSKKTIELLTKENTTVKKENTTVKRQLRRSEELRRRSEEQLRRHMVDLTETEQTSQGGEGIGSLASLHQTIKVKEEYERRAEETDKKLKELTAALERILRSKRKTRSRGGGEVNPEKEKEELIRNLSTHNVWLAQSKIEGAGIGVFAMTTIRKGTKLFQMNGEPSGETISLTETEISQLPPHVQTVVKAFLLPDDKGSRDVPKNGLSLALGVSFYLNTAKGTRKNHNVEFSEELDAFGFNTMITTQHIKEGEELLLSYDVGNTK